MADYQSLLTRAVANLPPSSTAAARRAIYDRARKALVTQLRSLRPPLPDSDIAREETALERAIEAVEANFVPAEAIQPDAARRDGPPEGSAAAPHAPMSPPGVGPGPLARPPAPASRPIEPRPIPARPSAPISPPRPPAPPISTRPVIPSRADAPKPPPIQVPPPVAEGADAPPVMAAKSEVEAPESANLATVVPSEHARAVETSEAPPIVTSPTDEAGALPLAPELPIDSERGGFGRPEAEGLRPVAPSAPVEARRTWPWAALAVAIGIVLAVAVAAILMRQKPQDLAIAPPAPVPSEAQGPAKIAQRAQPSPGGSQEPPSPQPAPSQPAPEGAGPAANASQPGQPAAQLPSAARGAMLIASADNPQKPVVNLGSTVWTTIPAPQGQPSGVAVEADADIPDLKMHAAMILRKNTDPTLQATHTIDLKFTFQDGAPIAGFKDVGLPQMRKLDSTASEALNAVKVKIDDDYFLFALAKGDQDAARNLDLMQTRAWFDFPLLLNDNRIAKLVFQKSAEGDAMLQKAFEAWK